jgi:hypothetical protein
MGSNMIVWSRQVTSHEDARAMLDLSNSHGRTGLRYNPGDHVGKSREASVASTRNSTFARSRSPFTVCFPPLVFLASCPHQFLASHFLTFLSATCLVIYAFKPSWLRGPSRIRRQHMSFVILSSRKCAVIPLGPAWYIPIK